MHAGGATAKMNLFGSDLAHLGYERRRKWYGGRWPVTERINVGVTEDDIQNACG